MGEDYDNPIGEKLKNGKLKKMSSLLNLAVFPGNQGGPLEHVVAAKAVGFWRSIDRQFFGIHVKCKEQCKNQWLRNS